MICAWQAHNDAVTAREEANAETWNNKKMRERLQQTEAERDSLVAALTAKQQACAKAERWLAFNQRVHGDHAAGLGLLAQKNPGAREVRGQSCKMFLTLSLLPA